MHEAPRVVIHHGDVHIGERLLESIERRCSALAAEFNEAKRFELSFEPRGAGVRGQLHATGSHTDVATHAEAEEVGIVTDRVFEKIERRLRRVHDKRIFARRRDAKLSALKRHSADG